jgi:signal transduction histidine kinase/CheY-like chemotaxis protein
MTVVDADSATRNAGVPTDGDDLVRKGVWLMLDAVPMPCVLFDCAGTPLDCNAQAVETFGCRDKQDFVGRFHTLSPERQPDGSLSRERMRELIRQTYEAGGAVLQWGFVAADGAALPAELTMKRVLWRDYWCVVACLRDLRETEEARARAVALETKLRAAQAATDAKSNFLASMSHDIRTPLHAIMGLAHLMPSDNLDDRQGRYLDDIRNMSRRLLQILDDILDISMIESGKLTLHPVHYDVRAMCDGICALAREAFAGRPVAFNCLVADDVPEVLIGDESRLRQVVFNMLNNAVQHMAPGRVELHVQRGSWRARPCLVVTVKDTGIGLKVETLPNVFDRFPQFDTRKNHGVGGTGLGLAIAKRLVGMMDGKIFATSRYGKGSEFTAYLPLVEGEAARVVRPEVAPRRVTVRPDARLLVVDDNPVNLTVALGYLRRYGVRADSAPSGAAAIGAIRRNAYDLVFMDHMMPEMDGIEATRRIRVMDGRRYKDLPIIALSANVLPGVSEAFLAAGMNDFVPKPIHPGDLNRVLLAWLPLEKLVVDEAPERADGEEPAQPDMAAGEAVLDRERRAALLHGDEALYRKLLSDFRRNHGGDSAAVMKMLTAGDREGARRKAHTLKSTAAIIGAERLRAAAAKFERALSEKEGGAGNGAFVSMTRELDRVLGEIAKALPPRHAAAAGAGTVDRVAAKALLDKLEPMLATGDAGSLDMMDALGAALAPLGAAYEAFSEQVDDLDFPGALKALPALRDALDALHG